MTASAQNDHDRMARGDLITVPEAPRRDGGLPDDVRHLSYAAEQLSIGLSTAYRLAAAGQIPGAFRVGSQWRISVPRFQAVVHGQAS